MAIGTIGLMFTMRGRDTGVAADPRSLASVSMLMRNPMVRQLFRRLVTGCRALPLTEDYICRRIGRVRLCLGGFVNKDGHADYGILTVNSDGQIDRDSDEEIYVKDPLPQTPIFHICAFLSVFIIFLIGFIVLIYYYLHTVSDTLFERFMGSVKFGGRFLFACCGVVINFAWLVVFNGKQPSQVVTRTHSANQSML
jgi:hypothetical protein